MLPRPARESLGRGGGPGGGGRGAGWSRHRLDLVQRQIEPQNVHSRVAQDAQVRTIGVLLDQFHDLFLRHLARVRHTLRLQPRVLRTDVRIQPRAGGRDGVGGDEGGEVGGDQDGAAGGVVVGERVDEGGVVEGAVGVGEGGEGDFLAVRNLVVLVVGDVVELEGDVVLDGVVDDAEADAVVGEDFGWLSGGALAAWVEAAVAVARWRRSGQMRQLLGR